jgi:xanthine dehydrogenase large subunit
MKQDVTTSGRGARRPHHDSAIKHVTGRADYTDDMPEPAGTLHACSRPLGGAHGEIEEMDFELRSRRRRVSSAC